MTIFPLLPSRDLKTKQTNYYFYTDPVYTNQDHVHLIDDSSQFNFTFKLPVKYSFDLTDQNIIRTKSNEKHCRMSSYGFKPFPQMTGSGVNLFFLFDEHKIQRYENYQQG